MDAAVLTRVPAGVRARTLPAAAVLTVLVAASSVVRFLVLALRLQTPMYLPDEYTYSALARSIAETGHPTIRGVSAHFPALLEPILAAPFWLTHDPGLALRLTQAEHSVLMSLGAIPVYLLCRRLSLGTGYALAAAVLTLVSADLSYASYVMAEPLAFPLVLATVYAAVVALESPSRRAQLALVGLIGLSTFARLQLVVLAPVVIVAGLIVERFDLRRFAAKCGLMTAGLALPVVAALAAGPERMLGTYHGVLDLHATAGTVAHQVGLHLLLVVFVSSVVLLPGALVALANGIARPQTVTEKSFAWLTVLLGAGVIAQAVFIGSTVSGGFGERYLIYVVPLLAAAFGLYARRGGGRTAVLGLSAFFALLAMRFPLTHYTGRSSDSPLLWAVSRAQLPLGAANAALLVSLVAVALAVLAAAVGLRPQRRYGAALAVAIAVQAVVAAAAVSWDVGLNAQVRRSTFPAELRWIDHAAIGPVTMLQTPDSNRGAADEQFLWNRSLTRVGLLARSARDRRLRQPDRPRGERRRAQHRVRPGERRDRRRRNPHVDDLRRRTRRRVDLASGHALRALAARRAGPAPACRRGARHPLRRLAHRRRDRDGLARLEAAPAAPAPAAAWRQRRPTRSTSASGRSPATSRSSREPRARSRSSSRLPVTRGRCAGAATATATAAPTA